MIRLLALLLLGGCADFAGVTVAAKTAEPPVLPTANPPVANAHDTALEAAVARQLGPRLLQSQNLVIDRVFLVEGEWREDGMSRNRAVALQTHDGAERCFYVYMRLSQFGESTVMDIAGEPVTQPCR